MFWRRPKSLPPAPVEPQQPRREPRISDHLLALMRSKPRGVNPFLLPAHPPGVVPAGMAMDDATGAMSWAAGYGAFSEGQEFLGYPYLAELAQRPEYRRIAETIARHMTRKWIRITVKGDEDKADKVAAIEDAMKRLNVRGVFRRAAEQDAFFGRGHIYLDFGATDDRDELRTPIGDGRNRISRAKVRRGSFARLASVEAVWCYPTHYNSNDPLSTAWYMPTSWFVMGKEVHASRLLTFVGREVPDLLKPAYSFGGLSMSQMAKPYVENWLRTRQSVSDIINAFSVFVLKTNLGETLMIGGDQLFKRAELFNSTRDNRGLLMIDKETEDFANVAAPLSGLDTLQAQSQEHMAAVSGIPLVELLGIQPAGLNASSEGEMKTFDDVIHAAQEMLFRPNLSRVLGFIQLSEFGEIDPEIDFEFEPLWSLSEKEAVEKRLTEAQTDQIYVDLGALSPTEVRKRLAGDEDTPYAGLDVDEVPLPAPGETGDPPAPNPQATQPSKRLGADKGFLEADHPREKDGKFGENGAGSSATPEPAKSAATEVTKVVEGKRVQANGAVLPTHIAALKIPPAWTDVSYSADPKASLLVVGRDAKGRRQAIYSAEFTAKQAALKFARIKELDGKFSEIEAQNNANRTNATTKDAADCAYLIMRMGIRPGSDEDTGAKVKAYGATTLLGQHVVQDGDTVRLQFVGKKGVSLNLPVTDPDTAQMLLQRAQAAGQGGKLFPATDEGKLLDYVHTLDGHGFKTKDFRTLLGTRTAMQEVAKRPVPANEAGYKKAVMDVAKAVSSRLGNTPTVALQSYINPAVFAGWRMEIERHTA